MAIIVDDQHPDRRPDAPVPTGFNVSVPTRSDSIRFSGDVLNKAPQQAGGEPGYNRVFVTFYRLTRDRTWDNLTQFRTTRIAGGEYDENATEGVSTATGVVESWDRTLGVKVGADWGPFSAAVSASFSQGGQKSVTVDLYKAIDRTIKFHFKDGIDAEIVAWQLDESYVLNGWTQYWTIDGGDTSKVTGEMIESVRQEIQNALREGRKPNVDKSFSVPAILSKTNQYTLTSFPSVPPHDASLNVA